MTWSISHSPGTAMESPGLTGHQCKMEFGESPSTKVWVPDPGCCSYGNGHKFKGMILPWGAGGKQRAQKKTSWSFGQGGKNWCLWDGLLLLSLDDASNHSFLPGSISQSSIYPGKAAAPGSLLPWVLLCLVNPTKIHGVAPGITIILYIKV